MIPKNNWTQRVIIGGAGSTGSSLLRNILNRHTDIVATEETSILTKPELYAHWSKSKNRITKSKLNGLKSRSFHIFNGVNLDELTRVKGTEIVDSLIEVSDTFQEFMDLYCSQLSQGQETTWIEKTPINAFSFSDFLNNFENSKAILTVRNPYDTIVSLMQRGLNLSYSVGRYLCPISSGLSSLPLNQVLILKYENLITNPEAAVTELCSFLNIPFQEKMLIPSKTEEENLTGWKNNALGHIKSNSLNRFEEQDLSLKNQIKQAIDTIQVSPLGQDYFKLEFQTIREICDQLVYEYQAPEKFDPKLQNTLKKQLRQDRFNRIVRFYPTGINYPLSLKIQD